MNFSILNTAIIAIALLSACMPKRMQEPAHGGRNSRLTSIKIPIPSQLKPLISADKINAFSLLIKPNSCDQGVAGTSVEKFALPLDQIDSKLANEKIKQGCDYTVLISMGKANVQKTQLERIYLTNDLKDKQTKIPKEGTRSSSIKVTAILYATEDAKKDLSIEDLAIIAPSVDESDLDIGIQIGGRQGLNVGDFDWRANAVFSEVPSTTFSDNDYGSPYYVDVMTHTSPAQRDFQSGPSTHAHETLHGLQAEMRNKTSVNDGFFYLENGKGIAVIEPKENLVDVRNHIAPSFKALSASKFSLYLVNQTEEWKNILYIFDEWNGYIATTHSAVEIQRAGQWDGTNSDPVEGVVDLLYFCSASLITIKNTDPEYLKTNKQFKAAYAMLMEESFKWINEAGKESIWKNSNAAPKLQNFRSADDSAKVRSAIKEFMGDIWTKRVMGF